MIGCHWGLPASRPFSNERQSVVSLGVWTYEVADAPHFERYGDDFDGQAGVGGIEIWLPIGR